MAFDVTSLMEMMTCHSPLPPCHYFLRTGHLVSCYPSIFFTIYSLCTALVCKFLMGFEECILISFSFQQLPPQILSHMLHSWY